jgi:hypothetical protein
MKKSTICVFFLVNSLSLFSQNNAIIEGPVIDIGYNGHGALKGTAGIIGDNYYIIENDYGRALDFNNNIKTSLTILSLTTGNLVKRIPLNELVAAQSKQGINKVLFCGVVVWKDKVIGFFTYKDPNGTEFRADAIILSPDGRVEQSGQEIGTFTHEILTETIPTQPVGRKGGRNTLSVTNDFRFCFTPDSSHLLVQCAPDVNQANIRFKVYKPGMLLEKEINVVIPVKGKREFIEQFTMDNAGMIYLITRGDKFTLHTINTAQNNHLISKNFELIGKGISNASLGFTEKGTPIIAGVYHDNTKSSGIHGAYAFKPEASPGQFSINMRDFPDSVIENLLGKKALKKGEGLFEAIRFMRFVPKPGGGLYAFGQSNTITTVARGTTGALNSYFEETWLHAAYSITEEGKILWESIAGLNIGNRELATRHSRMEYAPFGEKVHGLIILSKPNAAHNYQASLNGTTISHIKGSKEIMDYPFVEGTLRQIGKNDIAVIGFNEGRNPKFRLIKIKF